MRSLSLAYVSQVYGQGKRKTEPLTCGVHGARWRALVGPGDDAESWALGAVGEAHLLLFLLSGLRKRSDRARERERKREKQGGGRLEGGVKTGEHQRLPR